MRPSRQSLPDRGSAVCKGTFRASPSHYLTRSRAASPQISAPAAQKASLRAPFNSYTMRWPSLWNLSVFQSRHPGPALCTLLLLTVISPTATPGSPPSCLQLPR